MKLTYTYVYGAVSAEALKQYKASKDKEEVWVRHKKLAAAVILTTTDNGIADEPGMVRIPVERVTLGIPELHEQEYPGDDGCISTVIAKLDAAHKAVMDKVHTDCVTAVAKYKADHKAGGKGLAKHKDYIKDLWESARAKIKYGNMYHIKDMEELHGLYGADKAEQAKQVAAKPDGYYIECTVCKDHGCHFCQEGFGKYEQPKLGNVRKLFATATK